MLIPVIVLAVSTALAFIAVRSYSQSNSDEKNCYEITVNEKSFKTSDFKTKSDGSIEFTADDGTIIRASEYEIKKPEEYCLTLPICLNRYSGVTVSSIHSFTENAHCKRA